MGTTAQVTAWSATVMGTTAQVTAWTAGGGPWGRGPLVLATYYCDFRCLNTKPFFINTDIWASIKCRFPDILIWISEAVFQNLIISHNRGKCFSESPKKKKKKTNKQKHFLRFIVAVINMLYPKIKHYNLSCSLSQQLNSALYQIFCSILLPQFNLCHP